MIAKFVKNNIITILLVVILSSKMVYSQEIIVDFYRDVLVQQNINPDDLQQVVDSVNAIDYISRIWCIKYCGKKKITSAIQPLKQLLVSQNSFSDEFSSRKGDSERASILLALISLSDSTIENALRTAIDSLSDAVDSDEITTISVYLKTRFDDSYGWLKLRNYFVPDSSGRIKANITDLLNFKNNVIDQETIGIIDSIISHCDKRTKIESLLKLENSGYSGLNLLLRRVAMADTNIFVKLTALDLLKQKDSGVFVNTLVDISSDEGQLRSLIIKMMLKLHQPALYKMIIDRYELNIYWRDSLYVKNEIDNVWNYSPTANELTSIIDTLKAAVYYFNNCNWFGGDSLLLKSNEILTTAKQSLLQGDTATTLVNLKRFAGLIDGLPMKFQDSSRSFIDDNAYRFIYPLTVFTMSGLGKWEQYDVLKSTIPNKVIFGDKDVLIRIKGTGFDSNTEIFAYNRHFNRNIIADSIAEIIIPEIIKTTNGFLKISVFNKYKSYSIDTLLLSIDNYRIQKILPDVTLPYAGDFTLEVTGKGFKTASKVLWNDSVRTTTFVSDSLLRASILAADVATVGDKIVRVKYDSTSSAISDSMVFSVVTALPKPVRLVIEKEIDNHNGTMTAWFGYLNVNDRSVYIPVGDKNSFSPIPIDRGQATIFLPGRHKYVFGVTFPNTINIEWQLNGRHAKAGAVCEN
jgi:hypothetical protein